MNIKKYIVAAALAGLFALPSYSDAAARNIWAQATPNGSNYVITDIKTVFVLPLRQGNSLAFQPAVVGEEGTFNQYLTKHLQDKVKNSTFISLAPSLTNTANHTAILNGNLSEAERGQLVAQSGAQAYIIPHIKSNGTRVDTSPSMSVPVTRKSYQKIKNGPHGSETLNYRSWNDTATIPSSSKTLQQTSVDFDVYDTNGQKIFTMTEDYHVYGVDTNHAYKQLINRFVDSWKGLKAVNQADSDAKTLQLRPMAFSKALTDDQKRAVDFIYNRAPYVMKNVKILDPNSSATPDYYISADLMDYREVENWNEPSSYATEKKVRTDYRDWYDSKGKKQRMTIEDYETEFHATPGYYDFESTVAIHLDLMDARTGNLLASQTLRETEETPAEAMRKMFKKFYNEIDKMAKPAK